MKKIIALIISCMLLFGLAACNGKTEYFTAAEGEYQQTQKGSPSPVYARTYEALGGRDVMPIGTFYGPSTGYVSNAYQFETMISEKYFDLFADCGLNFFTYSLDAATAGNSIHDMFSLCDQYGMGMFLMDSGVISDTTAATVTAGTLENLLKEYQGYSSLLGLHVKDEPNKDAIDVYADFVQTYQQTGYDEYYDLYFNLLPIYGTLMNMGMENYEEYVNYYIEQLNVEFVSWDFYPFGAGGGVNHPGYFENLSIIKHYSDLYEVPYWAFIQCGASFETPIDECVPNEDQFIWNVNTNLAYGVKGIQYFTLTQPSFFLDENDPEGATREGMFGVHNNINQWYYYAKKANKQIKAIDHILMHANNEGVIFHGNSPMEKSTGEEVIVSGTFRQLTGVSGSDALIGCFDYMGGTALYVVNNSYTEKDANINLYFDGIYGYDVIQRGVSAFVTGNALSLRLDGGEGALVVLK